MLRFLKDKLIVLVSPQPWNHLRISKHHYAESLAQQNDVLFLEPPQRKGVIRVHMRSHPEIERLRIVSWKSFVPRQLRFHAHPLYRWLIDLNAEVIVNSLGRRPDVAWSFDFNVFPNLRAFGAPLTIFHPVDPLSVPRHSEIGRSADLIITVSPRIMENFNDGRFDAAERLVVNHGISEEFAKLAASPPASHGGPGIHCGYFGNLDRDIINRILLREIVIRHPEINFHFWGPYKEGGAFSESFDSLRNCRLHGVRDKGTLASEVARMDCFVLAYAESETESDRSNAHKLLEYLSTGKVTITTRMDSYSDAPDLIRMSRETDDRDFPALFASVVANLNLHNGLEQMARRKTIALEFTYENNIARIDECIASRLQLSREHASSGGNSVGRSEKVRRRLGWSTSEPH